MREITHRRQRIIEYVAQYINEHGYSPSTTEIGEAVSLSSTASVLHQLDQLVSTGHATREPRMSRSVRLTGKGQVAARRENTRILDKIAQDAHELQSITPSAVPTYIQTSAGISMALPEQIESA